MSNVPQIPYREPLIDENGFVNRAWSDFFKKMLVRVGGSEAPTNNELIPVDTSRIEDNAVTPAKIANTIAGDGLSGAGGSPLSVNVDGTTIETSSDALRVKDGGITSSKIAVGSVAFAKLINTDWSLVNATASGSQKLGSGLYLQWGVTGSISGGTNATVSFPTTFPTACRQVIAGIQGNSAGSTAATGQFGTGNYTTTGFDLYNRTTVAYTFNYLAVGY